MPIRPPALDDRTFDDLVEEVLTRIPAHTPEWTNPRLGDPGRTLIELFAWLTDTLLYRANLIPERQRLAFLRLLGERLRPAVAAEGMVAIDVDDDEVTGSVAIRPFARIAGPVTFETRREVTVLPVAGRTFYKRPLNEREQNDLAEVIAGLVEVYQLSGRPEPYATAPLFYDGTAVTEGFDLVRDSVDKCLWIALLVADAEQLADVRRTLGGESQRQQQLINVGIVPTITVPALFENVGPRAQIPHVWELSAGEDPDGNPRYVTLDSVADSTEGLTRRGVIRLALPGTDHIAAPSNDVRANLDAGVGDRPPRLDDAEEAQRLVAWLRLRPTVRMESLSLSWAGINAVEIDQRETLGDRVVGQSDGSADQEMRLADRAVEPDSLVLQVEEQGRGYRVWTRIDDLATVGRDASVFVLDSEAGTVRFGDGVRGRIPEAGQRVRVGRMRIGGGEAGNLAPGTLAEVSAMDVSGAAVTQRLKVTQPVATEGGEDAETVDAAEKRIPELFRHRDRAVTEDDFKVIAARTPGVRLGRVEVLPRFKPHQRRADVPGVVSTVVLPFKTKERPPNPRPDRPLLENVTAYLDRRRPVATELYVIGCEYVPIGLSVGITVRDGSGRNEVVTAVRDALFRFLWPLAPGGPDATGWPLGRTVGDRELEVVVAQVAGVRTVVGVNVFETRSSAWRMIARPEPNAAVEFPLDLWQLPELLGVVVVVDDEPPDNLRGVPDPFETGNTVAVPVVPEVC